VQALKTHTRIEEEVFYPYIRQATQRADLVEEASIEHTSAKQLIAELESGHDGVHRHAVVKVLGDYVGHHIQEEEEKIFPLIEKTGVDLKALGEELLEHKQGRRGNVMQGSESGGAAGTSQRASAQSSFAAQAHSREEDEAYREAMGGELGRSAQHAKWIYARGENEDHHGQTLATRNPAVIKAWAEERRAKPATSPGGDTQNPRVLRFDFPDYDKGLQQVSWEAWCRVFEERGLVFLFQQHMKSGKQSNFFRLDSPQREDA
jgi:Hemerythrin HHE cation binding domain